MERPSTPPRAAGPLKAIVSPPTPEVTRRIEENRLRAKTLRDQHEAAARASGVPSLSRTASGFIATDEVHIPNTRKRAHDAMSSGITRRELLPPTSRDGRANGASPPPKDATQKGDKGKDKEDGGAIRPARKFTKFVDYDFGKMTDTKGGFLSADDDPWNKAMSGSTALGSAGSNNKNNPDNAKGSNGGGGGPEDNKPQGMTAREWERLQLLRRLRRQKAGPFEPGLSALTDERERRKCCECGTIEIDFVWDEVFGVAVCARCKEKMPERYSLLTKTECKEDYLLTDSELRDPELLPHLSRPNPHKSHWHDMMLFLRLQVEEYALGARRWGSGEALDAEFGRREADKKKRKEAKFREKLLDLKRRTRTDAYRRQKGRFGEAGRGVGEGVRFGDAVASGAKHVHEWGRVVENADGNTVKTCSVCGMEVEEMEL